MQIPTDPAALAAAILAAELPASAALGRPDVYPFLNAGADGKPLPFLGSSTKIDAGLNVGILSAVLYMMPATASGRQACPFASDGCIDACLAEYTGRMSMPGSRRARIRRHASFYADRNRFLADVSVEISKHAEKAKRAGKTAAIRLNGTTDFPWHRMPFTDHSGRRKWDCIHDAHPTVRFYEYTKRPLKASDKVPANLHLTFSVSERADSERHARAYLEAGYSAAVVTFTRKHDIPAAFALEGMSYPCVDGDAHDARFLDPAGHIVILAAKGRAKQDASGFVRAIQTSAA